MVELSYYITTVLLYYLISGSIDDVGNVCVHPGTNLIVLTAQTE